MKKIAFVLVVALTSFSAATAQAGGFGRSGWNAGMSSGLINVSPSIGLGNITALNNVLSGNAILSGNNVSGILNGTTNLLSGVLGSVTNAVSQGNSYKSHKSYKLRRR